MNKDLYEQFPHIISEGIIIRKMEESDLAALSRISHSDLVYRYCPDFLCKKSDKELLTAIKNIYERGFARKKEIIAGVCLEEDPDTVIGLAEIFDYDKQVDMITIGYRFHEDYWGKGIATKVVKAMSDYLIDEIGINRLQAEVMPENLASQKVLLKNGFTKEGTIRQANYWKGIGIVDLVIFGLLKADR